MRLRHRLDADLKTALKGRETERLSVLRLLLSQVRYAEIDHKVELSDEQVQQVIAKAVKDRHEAAALYRKGERLPLAEKEEREAVLLQAYLPEPLTGTALEQAIEAILEELGTRSKRDIGRVMKEILARHRVRVDGAEASRLLAARLS